MIEIALLNENAHVRYDNIYNMNGKVRRIFRNWTQSLYPSLLL
jgi:hypothetical protein